MPSSSKSLRRVAVTGVVEGTTYLVLLAAVIWKRALDGPDTIRAVGLAHGIAFLVYAAAVLAARRGAGWDSTTTVYVLAASAVPAGGFVVARRVGARRVQGAA